MRALEGLIRKVVGYQLFAILLADDDGTLTIRHSIGYRADLAERLRVKLGEGITGTAAQTRTTIVVNDVTKDPRYLMAIDAVRSEIAVPLIARGKLVGVIDLQSSVTGAFGDQERNLLELIGSRFSLAIDAAGL
jgi:sigma-B regulation protein RsbU (phosphoserine phosphatase)